MPPNLPARIDTGSCSGMELPATVRKYLHTCISANALSAYLTSSLILSREMRKTELQFGLDEGMSCMWGSPLLITWQKHTATLCDEWGTGVLSFPLALIKVCPRCQDALHRRQKTTWKSNLSAFHVLRQGSSQVCFRTAYI